MRINGIETAGCKLSIEDSKFGPVFVLYMYWGTAHSRETYGNLHVYTDGIGQSLFFFLLSVSGNCFDKYAMNMAIFNEDLHDCA